MMTSLKDYMEEQNLNNIIFMLIESFEITIGRKLTNDEMDYLSKSTKKVFDQYAVVYDKQQINFAGPEEKAKVDAIVKKFMIRLTKLMTHYIFSRVEAYILSREIKRLREQKPQD
jgi:hypothetical protein